MNPLIAQAEALGLSRREFLRNLLFTAGSVSTATWLTACGSSSTPGGDLPGLRRSKFADIGPLLAPDENGLQLPAGFTSRVVAVYNEPPIPGIGFRWHSDPDGAGMFRTDDGGWIYVSNAEVRDATTLGSALSQAIPSQVPLPLDQLASRESMANPLINGLLSVVSGLPLPIQVPLLAPLAGGASALRFDADGNLIDAYPIQRDTTTNCSGGATPWGTWINGEEIVDGYMFEASPLRDGGTPVRLDRFGRKAHEQVAIDVNDRAIYHTEDITSEDRFYRTVFPTSAWPAGGKPDYSRGVLQVLAVEGGSAAAQQGPAPIRWVDAIDDGTPQFRVRLENTTSFPGNEGVWFLNGFVYFSSKGDDNIWVIDTIGNTIESIYNPAAGDAPIGSPVDPTEPPMAGVDNLCMTLDGEMIVVEDGGFNRAMVLLPDRSTIPLLRIPGDHDGAFATEVTGPAFSPDGRRLYVASQRALRNGSRAVFSNGGIVYEITMPFAARVDPPLARPL